MRLFYLIFRLLFAFDSVALIQELYVIKPEPKWMYIFHNIAAFFEFSLLLDAIRWIANSIYRKRKGLSSKAVDNVILGTGNIFDIIMSIAIVVTVMSFFNLSFKELFTSLSIFAAAIALLSKDYVSNFINGMIIAFSNQLSIDDQVKIGEQKGKIIDINLLNIYMLNDDDDLVIIPNNRAFDSEVINYTKREIKKTSIDFEVDIKHMMSIEAFEQKLIEELADYQDKIAPNSYNLKVVSIRKDSLSLKFQYIMKEPNRLLEKEVRRHVVRFVADYLTFNNNI